MIFINTKFRMLVSLLFIGWTIQLQAQTPEPFVTTWEVADDGNAATTDDFSITIPIMSTTAFSYSYTVDWGDGVPDNNRYKGDAIHTYLAAGTYTVTISGDFPAIYFDNLFLYEGDNSLKIKTIKSWGTQRWLSLYHAFAGCQNLTIEDGAGVPDLTMVTNMHWAFGNAISFKGDLSNWDVSNVINMGGTFFNASRFTSDLSSWNVSKVIRMWRTFEGASRFTSNLSSWNVSNVIDMDRMFKGAENFNSDISSWDVSRVGSMDGYRVGMPEMFSGANSFNSDLSTWNVSNVTSMAGMFQNATSFSSKNYDTLLTGWSSLPTLRTFNTFGAPPTTYCNGKAGRSVLTGTYNWTILGDNGEDCSATSVDDEFLSNTKIYPNPANSKINIESSFSIDKLELYNVLGAKIFSVSKTNVLDLTSLKQGIYILKVFSADRMFAKKVIKD